MSDDAVLTKLLDLTREIAGPLRAPKDAGPETALTDSGFSLDSVSLLELVVACEREFGVVIDPGVDLTPETVASVRRFATVIQSKAR